MTSTLLPVFPGGFEGQAAGRVWSTRRVLTAELQTQVELEIGDPKAEVQRLSDFTDVIRWYQPFIYVKLCRAIGSRACEDLETDEEMKRFPKDSEGTAKIALIAMDRSISAWAGLRESLGNDADGILD